MTYVSGKISREEFLAWIRNSTPRRVVKVGRPNTNPPFEREWSAYIEGIQTMSGLSDQEIHGAYALVSFGQGWVDGNFYLIPAEVEIQENVREEMIWRNFVGSPYRTDDGGILRNLVKNGDVDERWVFSTDPDSLLRRAAINVGRARWRDTAFIQAWRERIERAVHSQYGDEATYNQDVLRRALSKIPEE